VAALEPLEQFLQHRRGLVIAGTERPAASGQWFEVQNPASGEHLATVADSGPADVDAAVEAARAALGPWSAEAPARRAELLWELGRRIDALATEFARLEVRRRSALRRFHDERVRQGTRPRGPGFLPANHDRVDRSVVRDTYP
jgi:acyl-CoA reductase-like NAD-dependent aldehyde dehydrogenase